MPPFKATSRPGYDRLKSPPTMSTSFLQEAPDGERSSVRSSEDGPSSSPPDLRREKMRLENKIEEIKVKISSINVACEEEVENFLKMSKHAERDRGVDNPQIARIKQQFEKTNKRNTQDLDNLQKKLANYEQKLRELENRDLFDTSSSSHGGNIVSSVGQGIRRTGANIKGLTETVMSAPLDFAHLIKNSFGSADNINESNSQDVNNVGHSTFYASSEKAVSPSSAKKSSTLPAGMQMSTSAERSPFKTDKPIFLNQSSSNGSVGSDADNQNHGPIEDVVQTLIAELRNLRETNVHMGERIEEMGEKMSKELKYLEKSLQEDRFKYKKLEEMLNDTIDLHQAEMKSVRQDLSTIANRLDYQYNDRFKKVEETIESAHNQMFRMESSIKETMDIRLQSGAWNDFLLGVANIVVEFLKLVLFVLATLLDFFKPFTGTRTRAGVLLTVILVLLILYQNVDVGNLFRSFSSKKPLPNSPTEL